MSPRFRFPIWLWAALAVSTAVSLWVSAERYKDETANRAVHLLIDMPDVRVLAGSTGKTVPEVLQRLKARGATAVAVAEETFDELVATGRLVVEPGSPVQYRVTQQLIEQRLRVFVTERLTPATDPVAEI